MSRTCGREDKREWCPLCETPAPNTKQLARHMKEAHQRIILEIDINAQIAAIRRRIRLITREEDLIFA
jgi:hypothetical protein